VGAVVAKLRQKMPQAKVLVMSILPRGDLPRDKQQAYTKINPMIAKLADGKSVFYLDICEKYFRPDDTVAGEEPSAIDPPPIESNKTPYRRWLPSVAVLMPRLFDLLQRTALGLGNHQEHEEEGSQRACAVEEEGGGRAESH